MTGVDAEDAVRPGVSQRRPISRAGLLPGAIEIDYMYQTPSLYSAVCSWPIVWHRYLVFQALDHLAEWRRDFVLILAEATSLSYE